MHNFHMQILGLLSAAIPFLEYFCMMVSLSLIEKKIA